MDGCVRGLLVDCQTYGARSKCAAPGPRRKAPAQGTHAVPSIVPMHLLRPDLLPLHIHVSRPTAWETSQFTTQDGSAAAAGGGSMA
jgi:hypothetical protein